MTNSGTDHAQPRILLVDDLELTRSMMRLELVRLGLRLVDESEHGEQAWNQLVAADAAKTGYSLVISDWNMPGISGMELLERMRADPRFKKVAFIMLTAETELEFAVKALSGGASDYLNKPVSPELLRKKVVKVLGLPAS
jgi:two-component system, chemotaxis family, chemotaxis protein CheY